MVPDAVSMIKPTVVQLEVSLVLPVGVSEISPNLIKFDFHVYLDVLRTQMRGGGAIMTMRAQ